MALGGIWSRITGGIVALGVGAAARDAIDPVLEVEKQQAWARRAVKTLDPEQAALASVKGVDDGINARDDAKRHGIGQARWHVLRELQHEFPAIGELLTMYRRYPDLRDNVREALKHEQLPDEWISWVLRLVDERLSPADMANAVQQAFVPNAGLLPGDVSGPPFDVPAERIDLDTLKEFADWGVDEDRAKVLARLVGLPPGPVELSQMVLRDIVSRATAEQAIAEGHTKTKWRRPLLYLLTHPLLNPGVFVRRYLKGWDTEAQFHDKMALHGYTPEQSQEWYEAEGRPAAPQQMATAWARGVDGPDGRPMDEAQYLKGIRESDIRPEWGPMLWGIRFAYPPLFQTNRLVQAGAIDAATGAEWLHKNRYAPEVVEAFTTYWGGGTTGTAESARVKSAVTGAVTEIRNAFILGNSDEGTVRGWLGRLDLADDADGLINVWTLMREVPQKGLTAAQVKKAFRGDPALHPRTWAIAQLMELGYTADDAAIFLDE